MPDLSHQFRRSFLNYLRNPSDVKIKKDLVESSIAIYKYAYINNSLSLDKCIPCIYDIVKSSTTGIKLKLNLNEAQLLENYVQALGFSDLVRERQAFHAINIAYSLLSPKKSCLKEILKNFLIIQDKLIKEDDVITDRNFYGSFYLSNLDVIKVRAKKSVMDNLIKAVCEGIYNLSYSKKEKYFPVSYNLRQKILHIEKHIDTLSEKKCEKMLSHLAKEIGFILSAKPNSDDIRDDAKNMTNSGKRSALKTHSFSSSLCLFLSKALNVILEVLGIETAAEKLLKKSVEETKKLGVQ